MAQVIDLRFVVDGSLTASVLMQEIVNNLSDVLGIGELVNDGFGNLLVNDKSRVISGIETEVTPTGINLVTQALYYPDKVSELR